MIIKNNKSYRSVKKYTNDVQNQVHEMYNPVIDLLHKLYCVPSQADETYSEITKLLNGIRVLTKTGGLDRITIMEDE